jgi:hypothetical protein
LGRRCFQRMRNQCNCGLVFDGSDCAAVESRECEAPAASDRAGFLREVRTEYRSWCLVPPAVFS